MQNSHMKEIDKGARPWKIFQQHMFYFPKTKYSQLQISYHHSPELTQFTAVQLITVLIKILFYIYMVVSIVIKDLENLRIFSLLYLAVDGAADLRLFEDHLFQSVCKSDSIVGGTPLRVWKYNTFATVVTSLNVSLAFWQNNFASSQSV